MNNILAYWEMRSGRNQRVPVAQRVPILAYWEMRSGRNSAICAPTNCPVTVHPHARGEQSLICSRRLWGSGSSPRTWGTVR